jgi:DNA sulfur modification protein DndB
MKHEWKKVEKRVLKFISKDLQANYSAGGPACRLSGYQVDAYGIFGKVAIIFECKTTAADRRININKAVDQLAGRRPAICRALRERHGRHLKCFRFVVVVGNASEIVPYTRRSRKPKDIFVWSPKYFDAIEGLARGIKSKAVPYILKELRVKDLRICLPQKKKPCILPAIRVNTNSNGKGAAMYSFFATAQSLLDLCYVARVESDYPNAYQRLLNKSRLKKIGAYINNEGTFKNSVVLNIPSSAKFRKKAAAKLGATKASYGLLKIPYVPASLWIIDGQHRIYGFTEANEKRLESPISVIGLQDLDDGEQGRIFVQINANQKAVDPNRLWDLYSQLYAKQPSGVISQLVKDLAEKKSSALHKKIYIPSVSARSRKYHSIYMVNICEAIERQSIIPLALNLGTKAKLIGIPISQLERGGSIVQKRLNIFCSAIRALCRSLKNEKWWKRFFVSNNGISVLIRLLRETLVFEKVKWQRKYLKDFFRAPLRKYFDLMAGRIDEIIRNTSSEAGRAYAALDLYEAVREFHDKFAEDRMREARRLTSEDHFTKIIGTFEKKLREIIRQKLEKITVSWWNERIPPDVQEKANSVWEKGGRKGDQLDRVELSDYIRIISRNWSECFEADYRKVNRDKNALNLKFSELAQLRNSNFHFHGPVNASQKDIWQARILTDQILEPFA